MSAATLEELRKEGTAILAEAGISEAGLDAWLLLEYTTGCSMAYYYAHGEETITEPKAQEYRALIKKRAGRVPLQHLTHQAFFMGYEFYVNDQVLAPRQDTETLVEEALKLLEKKKAPWILDMCTGSGCILLSLLAQLPQARGTGADLSEQALLVARRNAAGLQLENRAEFVTSDLFSGDFFRQKNDFPKKDGKEPPVYDMLIANPPYIPTGEIDRLMDEVRLFEPRMALDGREDGLYFYRAITEQAEAYLKSEGWLLYEIGYDQGEAVAELMKKAGFTQIRVVKDLCGLDRVVMGKTV